KRGKNHYVPHPATLDRRTRRYHHVSDEAATKGGAEGCHFGEKDEQRVNKPRRRTRARPAYPSTSQNVSLNYGLPGQTGNDTAELRSPRLHPTGRRSTRRILRPGMSWIAPAQIGANRRIAAAPKPRQVARHLHRPVCRRQ